MAMNETWARFFTQAVPAGMGGYQGAKEQGRQIDLQKLSQMMALVRLQQQAAQAAQSQKNFETTMDYKEQLRLDAIRAAAEGRVHDLAKLRTQYNLMGLLEGVRSGYRTKELGVKHGYKLDEMEKGYGYDVGLIGARGREARQTAGHEATLDSWLRQNLMNIEQQNALERMRQAYSYDIGLIGARGKEARETDRHKSTLGEKPAFGGYGFGWKPPASIVNKAIGYGQNRIGYKDAQPFSFYFQQALNNARAAMGDRWHQGPYKPDNSLLRQRAIDSLRKLDTEGEWDNLTTQQQEMLIADEIKRLGG